MKPISICTIVSLCCVTMLGRSTSQTHQGFVGTVADAYSVPIGNARIVGQVGKFKPKLGPDVEHMEQ